MPSSGRSPDEKPSLAAATFLGIVGSFVLLILPVFVGSLIEYRGFTDAEAGWIGSADLMGFALASVLAFRIVWKHSWRRIVLWGLILIIAGDLSSVFISDFARLVAVRLTLSGFGAGLVIAVPYTLLGDTANPERNTGIYFTFNVLAGALGLFVVPMVVVRFGASGMFIFLAATAMSAIPVTLAWLPDKGRYRDQDGFHLKSLSSSGVLLILVGIASFNFGLGGVWAFVERIGLAWGLAGERVGQILSVTYLVSMAGSSAAAWQANRFGYLGPYVMGMVLMCTALVLLMYGSGVGLYTIALGLINFSWNYSLTYQFSAVYRTDNTGRMAVFIIMVQAFGLMLGPGVSGSLSTTAGYGASLGFGIAGCIVSLALFSGATSLSKRRSSY